MRTWPIFPTSRNLRATRESPFSTITAVQPRAGKLTEREKSLIALAVAHTEHCPYCIDAYTTKCLSLGLTSDEMMEAVHVGASMVAGAVLAHATQMRKIVRKNEM